MAQVMGATKDGSPGPVFKHDSLDVIISADSALVWDEKTGEVLYEKNANKRRPVASVSKLLSALTVREYSSTTQLIEILPEARRAQLSGANIKLPIGDQATVYDLLASGLIASANDAMVTLAVGLFDSEEEFVNRANEFAQKNGFYNTKVSNATGLSGGEQYSTAYDVMKMFRLAYRDQVLRNMMISEKGTLRTELGAKRNYKSTNKLLGTYFPVLAAKTGYTYEAGQNFVVMTYGELGQRIGVVVLGSEERFQDAKILVEWIWRNYEWS
jgi:D-alanyl-D-alanine carboxypeptidase